MRLLPSGKVLCAAMTVSLAVACSAPAGPPALPGLALATTVEAQAALRPLMKRWASALTREERAAVGPDLEAFVAKFPDDGDVPAASALLGWIAIERGELAKGTKLSQRATDLGPGSWQDFAQLIEGSVLRRRRDAKGALSVLTPLVSKLIDPWARDLLNEEMIAAAIAAGDVKLAVKMMAVWLREAGEEEQKLVQSRVERALASLGNDELVRLFDERSAKAPASPDSELDVLLVRRIAEIAIATKDALLAKRLLASSGALLGARGDDIAHLAAGAAAIRVDARTVGLLLSFRTADTRRRSAELAAGVTWGLELPGSGARLAVRDDTGDAANLEDALTELGRDGAAVVIAGVDEVDALAAARFAEDQHVPVILIAQVPSNGAARGPESYVFPLGASPEAWSPRAEPRFDAWLEAHGSPPSFWSAAGRDAAVLARRSVAELPQAATEERAEVEVRRKTVRAALGLPISGLWTRDDAGSPAARTEGN